MQVDLPDPGTPAISHPRSSGSRTTAACRWKRPKVGSTSGQIASNTAWTQRGEADGSYTKSTSPCAIVAATRGAVTSRVPPASRDTRTSSRSSTVSAIVDGGDPKSTRSTISVRGCT